MITAITPYNQNKNTPFGAKLPSRTVIVENFSGKQVIIDRVIKKPVEKDSAFQTLKHMFFEVFPKFDPEYRKLFRQRVNPKV